MHRCWLKSKQGTAGLTGCVNVDDRTLSVFDIQIIYIYSPIDISQNIYFLLQISPPRSCSESLPDNLAFSLDPYKLFCPVFRGKIFLSAPFTFRVSGGPRRQFNRDL